MLVKADMAPRRPLTRAAAVRAFLGLGLTTSGSSSPGAKDASLSSDGVLWAARLRLAVLLARGMMLWSELGASSRWREERVRREVGVGARRCEGALAASSSLACGSRSLAQSHVDTLQDTFDAQQSRTREKERSQSHCSRSLFEKSEAAASTASLLSSHKGRSVNR